MLTNAIVSNTGPIIALAKVECLHLLPTLFERVLVPEPVYREVLAGGKDNRAFLDACEAGRLRPIAVSSPIDPLLSKLLDQDSGGQGIGHRAGTDR
jgi:predicted nucleic acid-binding protein